MNRISVINHKPGFSNAPCAWIAIDGTPIERWCAEEFGYLDATSLGFAPMWLHKEDEEKLAWSRITPGEDDSSTVVPILVCSDDMDFDCSVLVVEQLIVDGTVQWLRWGFSVSWGSEVGISTKWEKPKKSPLATFSRAEFEECLRSFGQGIPGKP